MSISNYDEYYDSQRYLDAESDAVADAGPYEYDWDKRYIAALLERGLTVRVVNEPWVRGRPYPMTAPTPVRRGSYPYPSLVVRV